MSKINRKVPCIDNKCGGCATGCKSCSWGNKSCVGVPQCINGPCYPACTEPSNPFIKKGIATWRVNYLVANKTNQAANVDITLLNPWGIAILNNQLWVVNNSLDTIANFDLYGNKLLGNIRVRDVVHRVSHPTGLVINPGNGFIVSQNTVAKPSSLMTVTKHGTIHGFNALVSQTLAPITVDMEITNVVNAITGLAIANNTLYLADFNNRTIDVFDQSYTRLTGYPFVDLDTSPPIPQNFAPFNIIHIDKYLFVTWAQKDPTVPTYFVTGPGLGFISVFNYDGSFVRRFTSQGVLDTPWAMIPAPCECGFPPNSLLVGNRGDGKINVFDFCGRFVGPMLNQGGVPVVIEGLWGLAPYYTVFSEIFFTAAPDQNNDGIIGSLTKDQVWYY